MLKNIRDLFSEKSTTHGIVIGCKFWVVPMADMFNFLKTCVCVTFSADNDDDNDTFR